MARSRLAGRREAPRVPDERPASLSIADFGYVMETGRITLSGSGADLLGNDEVRCAYLGM